MQKNSSKESERKQPHQSDDGDWSLTIHGTLEDVLPEDWDALNTDRNPFMSHGFLRALETAECVGANSGWEPMHVCLRDTTNRLCGAMPMYLKYNSSGEFVFDWSWASAYEQHGLSYYPKLVIASPFSPVPGPRLLIHPDVEEKKVSQALLGCALAVAKEVKASSIHLLFAKEKEVQWATQAGFLPRHDCQFVWHNDGFQNFDDFTATLRSSKRKKLNRERRKVSELGIHFETRTGLELSPEDWDYLYEFYCAPYYLRGRQPYLNKQFFETLSKTLGEDLITFTAIKDKQPVAAAILIQDQQRLYGRYWGSAKDYDSLHFETCYYQGIEYAVARGLDHFEPGTQGEHKLVRGFRPTRSFSAHWIAHPGFADAIDDYLGREREMVADYMTQCLSHLPFRRDNQSKSSPTD